MDLALAILLFFIELLLILSVIDFLMFLFEYPNFILEVIYQFFYRFIVPYFVPDYFDNVAKLDIEQQLEKL